jgi:hypothetical protein
LSERHPKFSEEMVSASPLSALLTAIVIKNIDEVVYLVSIKNLRVELNDG